MRWYLYLPAAGLCAASALLPISVSEGAPQETGSNAADPDESVRDLDSAREATGTSESTEPVLTVASENPGKADADKKKKEALKKKIGTAYKDPFYLNDFSYLNDPNYKGFQLGEGLKGLELGETGRLDVGGQYRLRHHSERNMRNVNTSPGTALGGLTGRDDDFLLDRTRLYSDYKINQRLRVYAEFLHAKSHFEDFAPRIIEENDFDIQNLFADAVLIDSEAGKLSGRYGRQELLFGAQRLLSPLDWANTRRTFEGGRLTWSDDYRTTDLLLVRPATIRPDDHDTPNQDQALWGVYNSSKVFENGTVDTYYLGFENSATDLHVHTLGTLIKGESDGLLWDHELGYQLGRNPDGSSISEFSITLGVGGKSTANMTPTLWLYYDWASGDDDINQGWNHLFPLGHRYNGFMDLFGRRNLHDVNTLLTFNPTEKFTALVWYHYLFLENGNQGPYGLNMASFNPGGTVGDRELGHEIDLMGTYKLNPRSDLVLGFSHFFAGKYYETSTRSDGSALFSQDANFFYTQWHYNF
ncbi:alginate export family protein [Pirellulaceae bacterium SH501]